MDIHPVIYYATPAAGLRVTVRVCASLQAGSGISPLISYASNVRAGWWRETPIFAIYVLSTPADPLLFFLFLFP